MLAPLLRGLCAGLAFALALLLVESLGIALVIERWFISDAAGLLVRALPRVGLDYLLLGAALGVTVGFPLAMLQRRWKSPWSRSGTLIGAISVAFAVLALAYPGESSIRRSVFVGEGFAAWLVTGLFRLGLAVSVQLVRRFPVALGWLGRSYWAGVGFLVLACLAAGVFWFSSRATPRQTQRVAALRPASGPNIVLIVVDTLRHDHVSAYGYARPTTPNIDRLAREGALYEHAFSPSPWTLPAHASLFTGLYPSEHQTDHEHTRLSSEKLTLAEILHARGYQTAGFVANAFVSSFTGLDQGFQEYEYLGEGSLTHPFFINLIKTTQQDLGGRAVTERLNAWLQEARFNARPFFAFVNYLEVHEPYGTVPKDFRSRFVGAELPPDVGKTWIRETPRFLCASCEEGATFGGLRCERQRWRVNENHLRDIVALYDAGILYVDHLIGQVREKLEELAILDETLIIVTSDHGEMLGESGRIGHGVFLHNSLLRVPLVLRYPPLFHGGTRVPAAASLLDILPTVTEVAGIGLKPRPGSISLVPSPALEQRPFLVRAQEAPFRASITKSMERLLECDLRLTRDRRLSLQKESAKYVWASSGKQELFNLSTDPKEEHDLSEQLTDSTRELRKELLDWAGSVRATHGAPQKGEIDARTKRELESLGYLQ